MDSGKSIDIIIIVIIIIIHQHTSLTLPQTSYSWTLLE